MHCVIEKRTKYISQCIYSDLSSIPQCIKSTCDISLFAINHITYNISGSRSTPVNNRPDYMKNTTLLWRPCTSLILYKHCQIQCCQQSHSPADYHLAAKAKKKKILCLKAASRICFSMRVWFRKIQGFFFFFACLFFFQFFMNLLVKIYKKRYDRHNETLWTTDFFNSVFCLVFCSSKIKFCISKLWPTQIWHVCCSEKKKKKKKNAYGSGLPICHELWDIIFF